MPFRVNPIISSRHRWHDQRIRLCGNGRKYHCLSSAGGGVPMPSGRRWTNNFRLIIWMNIMDALKFPPPAPASGGHYCIGNSLHAAISSLMLKWYTKKSINSLQNTSTRHSREGGNLVHTCKSYRYVISTEGRNLIQ